MEKFGCGIIINNGETETDTGFIPTMTKLAANYWRIYLLR
jgi:hypothetical protein